MCLINKCYLLTYFWALILVLIPPPPPFCRSLLVHVENGYLGRGFEQFCPQLPHYNVYVDNMYDARKVLAVREPPRTG